MNDLFKGKRIFVTGACGTIGSALVKRLLGHYQAQEIICLDNNETELFFLEQELASQYGNVSCWLGDIRDEQKINKLCGGVDIIFHTAAYKHVVLCERSPFEAVQTNIMGVRHIIEAAKYNGVECVVFTSSDKAVNPTNVMGTSKLMGERLISAANSTGIHNKCKFTSTRFGNVLGSRGSVIPIFLRQIQKGGPVTITDPRMTRFVMSIEEAARLVVDSTAMARGGEVFVTKMPTIRVVDLASVMIKLMAPRYGYSPEEIEVVEIGCKPGEKMYEELISEEEVRRTYELERYFAVLPSFGSIYKSIDYDYADIVTQNVGQAYNSANQAAMTQADLGSYLAANHLLDIEVAEKDPDERYWP